MNVERYSPIIQGPALFCSILPVNLPSTHNSTVQGIGVLLVATLIFAFQDTITKTLVEDLPTAQIVFIRFVMFTLFAVLFVTRKTGIKTALRSKVPKAQILRTLVMCAEINLFTYGLRAMGVAEMHAIFSCFPLVIAALSVPMLGETVGWRRWVAVSVGFIGTLIILRPGSGVYDIYAAIPLACALLYSIYTLLTRQVSKKDTFETSLLYFGIVGAFAMVGPALLVWIPIPPDAVPGLSALCLLSVMGHWMLIKALELTEAVVLQPFNYLILVWAALFGYLFFGEVLDSYAVLGACIVCASGVYVGYREYRIARSS